jgi:single-strand DNA-binding protein
MNSVNLVGRITKDLELKYTPSGAATVSFSIAVNRPFKNQAGENEADFLNIVAWRAQAENVCNFQGKGSLISVTGRLQSRSYEAADGRKVYVTEVVAEHIGFLEKRDSGQAQQQGGSSFDGGESIDISGDDLPF